MILRSVPNLPQGRSTKTILLADDDQSLLDILAILLGETQTFRIVAAVQGEEALRLAREHKPDLALMDVNMPKMDGFSVCRAIKASPATSHTKVLIMTAMRRESLTSQARGAGADDWLSKPFACSTLLEKVYRLLE